MDLKNAFKRAQRGLREEKGLYTVAVSSLTVAFLCLAATLLGVTNLSQAASVWEKSGRLTVYLQPDADPQDVAQLRVVLEGLQEVQTVEHLSAQDAKEAFLEQSDVGADLSALPADVFPPSLEVSLAHGIDRERANGLAARIGQFRAVAEVESYGGWFRRLDSLIATGKWIATVLAVMVGFCVIAVIGNTIRLAVARRRQEIEVMRMCGATHGFVRGPFVLEGMFQGLVAATVAILVLVCGYLALSEQVDATLAALLGGKTTFLDLWVVLALLVGGAAIGALSSAVSVHRYLKV